MQTTYTEKPATVGLLVPNEYGFPTLGSRDDWQFGLVTAIGEGEAVEETNVPEKYWGLEDVRQMIDGVEDVADGPCSVTYPKGSVIQLFKLNTFGELKGTYSPSKLVQVQESGWTEIPAAD